jgi:hypothetical protein
MQQVDRKSPHLFRLPLHDDPRQHDAGQVFLGLAIADFDVLSLNACESRGTRADVGIKDWLQVVVLLD